jgi:hypothetical protein
MRDMSSAAEIRNNHFKQFSRLAPEKRLIWALSAGYSLWQIMPKDSKKYAEGLRNGWKRHLSRSRSTAKNS